MSIRHLALVVAMVATGATAAGQHGDDLNTQQAAPPDAVVVPELQLLARAATKGPDAARREAELRLRRQGTAAATALPALVEALARCEPRDTARILDLIAEVQPLLEPTPRAHLDAVHRAVQRQIRRADLPTRLAIRRAFVRVLVRSHSYRRDAEATIVQGLVDNAALHREFAAEMAGARAAAGDPMTQALPVLLDILEHEPDPIGGGKHNAFGERFVVHDRLLMKAAWAVEQIRGRPLRHVHAYRYWLRHGDAGARFEAARALAIDPRDELARQVVPSLIEALDDPDDRVVGEAITALSLFGEKAQRALPRLGQLAKRGDRQVATRARAAIRQLR